MRSNNVENRTGLKSSIGLPQAIALYIGAVLGSGVLIVPGLAAEIAGPASLLAWGLMTLLVLPMALSMGLLSAKYPNAGGVSHFVTLAFGPRTGSLVGWFFLMSVPIGGPVAALTGAGYLTAALGLGEGTRVILAAIMLILGLLINLIGMKVVGRVQIAVVIAILTVLLLAIVGALPHMEQAHFTPFMPSGWGSVGKASVLLFWCFIGWEAVSHLSEEFIDPQKAAIKGVTIAAIIVGLLYFLTALVTVGTQSYLNEGSEAPLVAVISGLLGPWGALIAGLTGMFICVATIIAYVGATSRLAYSLARQKQAPRVLGIVSKRFGTPIGGIGFLTVCFAVVLVLYASGASSLTNLIQLPNATFILTYLGGCAAGTRLLKGNAWGVGISVLSLLATVAIFLFVGNAVIYPLIIAAAYGVFAFFQSKQVPVTVPYVYEKKEEL
ncbi:MAG: amino acid permease [Gorillibacterium sp.]|nr:amino acid permease [Gorillibacterium sp.]